MEDKELIICCKSIEELKAQLGVWASMCPSAEQCIGIRVKLGPAQIENLFYKLWDTIGDEKFRELIEREGFKVISKTKKYDTT